MAMSRAISNMLPLWAPAMAALHHLPTDRRNLRRQPLRTAMPRRSTRSRTARPRPTIPRYDEDAKAVRRFVGQEFAIRLRLHRLVELRIPGEAQHRRTVRRWHGGEGSARCPTSQTRSATSIIRSSANAPATPTPTIATRSATRRRNPRPSFPVRLADIIQTDPRLAGRSANGSSPLSSSQYRPDGTYIRRVSALFAGDHANELPRRPIFIASRRAVAGWVAVRSWCRGSPTRSLCAAVAQYKCGRLDCRAPSMNRSIVHCLSLAVVAILARGRASGAPNPRRGPTPELQVVPLDGDSFALEHQEAPSGFPIPSRTPTAGRCGWISRSTAGSSIRSCGPYPVHRTAAGPAPRCGASRSTSTRCRS